MQLIDTETVDSIEEAKENIKILQFRLIDCERHLDDMARSAEIAVITKQFHLMESFINQSNEFLSDRLMIPEQDTSGMKLVVAECSGKKIGSSTQES